MALAGGLTENDNLLDDSDDSLPEDNLDLAPDNTGTNHNSVPRFSEDIENIMSGSNIMPKALPQVTPDSQHNTNLNAGQNYQAQRAQNHHHNQRSGGIKRRHSGKDGGKCMNVGSYFAKSRVYFKFFNPSTFISGLQGVG